MTDLALGAAVGVCALVPGGPGDRRAEAGRALAAFPGQPQGELAPGRPRRWQRDAAQSQVLAEYRADVGVAQC